MITVKQYSGEVNKVNIVWFEEDIAYVIHLNDQTSGKKARKTFPIMIGRRLTKLFADPTQTRLCHDMFFMFVYQRSVLSPLSRPNFS